MTSFAQLGVPERLLTILNGMGATSPFPIQEATLPSTMAGRDVLGRGQTGSGKTLAFSLPIAARLAASGVRRASYRPRALIMAPTRELATQISRTVDPLASALGLKTAVVFGGVSQHRQVQELKAGVDVLIACPGRLEDLIGQGYVDLSTVEISVLDEADHMADMGFLPMVRRILDRLPRGIQHMLFSATLDNGVDTLVKRYLDRPVTHSVDAPQAAVETMTHHVLVVDADEKKDLVRELAAGAGRRIMFMRTKHHAKKMALWLSKSGVPAVDLHGNLSQNARDRNLAAFSAGDAKVLVATDVAARGVHVDGVELVVHIDPPTEHKSYLHRSGRTARAGSEGAVVTISTYEQQREVSTLLKAAGISVPFQRVSPDDDAVLAIRGAEAEAVEYVAPQPRQQQARPKADRPRGGGDGQGEGRRGGRSRRRPGSAEAPAAQRAQGEGRRSRPQRSEPAAGQEARPARQRPAQDGESRRGGRPQGAGQQHSGGAGRRDGQAGGEAPRAPRGRRGTRRATAPATGERRR
ncbi:DEAD/DEAH box helicase [Zhihengliuella sp.]|uniref:DEAD/DEAH box helicase n=1 Tax=Zhihengliuella sp. TaxID=1954483 RepID=UPI0028126A61|nr:DEAD/DEAH box helicase [Zhihengliuella sp.]